VSTIGAVPSHGFAIERVVIRVGRAMVVWGERRARREDARQALYRRQAAVEHEASMRSALVRSQLLP
jgi:hypothetical protein